MAAGPPGKGKGVQGGAANQRVVGDVDHELVAAQEVPPKDMEGDVCA